MNARKLYLNSKATTRVYHTMQGSTRKPAQLYESYGCELLIIIESVLDCSASHPVIGY